MELTTLMSNVVYGQRMYDLLIMAGSLDNKHSIIPGPRIV
jgi:hypothetical protein